MRLGIGSGNITIIDTFAQLRQLVCADRVCIIAITIIGIGRLSSTKPVIQRSD